MAIFGQPANPPEQTFQTNQLQKSDSRDKSARDKYELSCLITSFVEVITVFIIIYLQHLLQLRWELNQNIITMA